MLTAHFRRIASVPFANKDSAKALGCTWVAAHKGWQVNNPEAEVALSAIDGVAFGWYLPTDKRSWNAAYDWADTLSATDKRAFGLLVENPFWVKNPPIAAFVAKYGAEVVVK